MAGKKKFEDDSEAVRPAAATPFSLETIQHLAELLERSSVSRISWRRGSERLVIQKGVPHGAGGPLPAPTPLHPSAPVGSPAVSSGPRMSAPEPPATASAAESGILVTSPFVGTFYRAAGPDQPVFVELGSVVKKGQAICIIEAMKLMNEIESEVAGKVTEILAENGQPVEFGQALFRIEPL